MSKYKSKAQDIGEQGESIFHLYALRELKQTPNKLSNDYGIDFVLQISGEMLGEKRLIKPEFIGVNVKSSEQTNPVARLTNEDMEFNIRASHPIVFILVDINTQSVYHRFFDEELLKEFSNRLLQKNRSFLLTPKVMSDNTDDFFRSLRKITSRSYQNRLNVIRVELNLNQILGNVRLEIKQSNNGSFAFIEVEDIATIFDKKQKNYPLVREKFLSGNLNKEIILSKDSIKNFFTEELKNIAERSALFAQMEIGNATIRLIRKGRLITMCDFEMRRFGDEISYYHPSGLSLSVSKRRLEVDGHYYHHLETFSGGMDNEPLFNYQDVVNLLRNCQSGDKLKANDGSSMKIEHWPNLIQFGEIINKIIPVYRALKITPAMRILDLEVHHYIYTIYFLYELLVVEKGLILPGFVLDNNNHTEEVVKWLAGEITCPIIAQLPEGKIMLKVKYFGHVGFIEDNSKIIGLKFTKRKELVSTEKIQDEQNVPFPVIIISEGIGIVCKNNEFKATTHPYKDGLSIDQI
jgi:hypothetical protein